MSSDEKGFGARIPWQKAMGRRRFLAVGGSSIGLLILSACSREDEAPGATEEPTVGLEAGPVVIYNWGEYGPVEENMRRFQDEVGAEVQVEFFSNNDEMLSQLQAGATGWDIVVPQDFQIQTMIGEELLLALSKDQIPNLSNADPTFLGPSFDPGNEYTVPKTWGATGITWRTDRLGEGFTSWADFLALSKENSGRVIVLDSPIDVIGSALKATGNSLNATDDAAFEAAEKWLLDLKPHLLAIVPDGEQTALFTNEEALLGISTPSVTLDLDTEGVPIGWVYPFDGGLQFLDNWAIPATAPNPNLAHAFMNFMLEPKSAANEMNELSFNTANQAARDAGLIDEKVLRYVQPTSEAAANYEYQETIDADARRKRSELWTTFTSA